MKTEIKGWAVIFNGWPQVFLESKEEAIAWVGKAGEGTFYINYYAMTKIEPEDEVEEMLPHICPHCSNSHRHCKCKDEPMEAKETVTEKVWIAFYDNDDKSARAANIWLSNEEPHPDGTIEATLTYSVKAKSKGVTKREIQKILEEFSHGTATSSLLHRILDEGLADSGGGK